MHKSYSKLPAGSQVASDYLFAPGPSLSRSAPAGTSRSDLAASNVADALKRVKRNSGGKGILYGALAIAAVALVIFGLDSIYGFLGGSSPSNAAQRTATVALGTVQSSVSASGNVSVATSASRELRDQRDTLGGLRRSRQQGPRRRDDREARSDRSRGNARSVPGESRAGAAGARDGRGRGDRRAAGSERFQPAAGAVAAHERAAAARERPGGRNRGREAASGRPSAWLPACRIDLVDLVGIESASSASNASSPSSTFTSTTSTRPAPRTARRRPGRPERRVTRASRWGQAARRARRARRARPERRRTPTTTTTTTPVATGSTGAAGSSGNASATRTAKASPPPATTGQASAIGSTTATLSGTVDPAGSNTTYWFEYGTSASSLGSKTQKLGGGSGTSPVSVTVTVKGLKPGQAYLFRLVAESSAGTGTGADICCATITAATPTVTTGSASNVLTTSATLSGSVDPNGSDTHYRFEYGTTSSYGKSTASQDAGSAAGVTQVTATVTGLKPEHRLPLPARCHERRRHERRDRPGREDGRERVHGRRGNHQGGEGTVRQRSRRSRRPRRTSCRRRRRSARARLPSEATIAQDKAAVSQAQATVVLRLEGGRGRPS